MGLGSERGSPLSDNPEAVNDELLQKMLQQLRGDTPYNIPTGVTTGVYQGQIPPVSKDYGSTTLELPHEYYQQKQLHTDKDPLMNLMLQMVYLQRKQRT